MCISVSSFTIAALRVVSKDVNRTLEVAVQEGHIDIIRDLIDAGADLFHRNSVG